MFLEADLIRVVRVRLVAVDGLGAVGILNRRVLLLLRLVVGGRRGVDVVAHAAELWRRRVACLGARGAAWVAGDGRGCLEAVELGGRVHLGRLVVELGFWAGLRVGGVGDGARGAGAWVLFVEGVRVDEGAVGGLGLGAIVEDPDDLRRVVSMRSGVG